MNDDVAEMVMRRRGRDSKNVTLQLCEHEQESERGRENEVCLLYTSDAADE